MPTIAAKVLLAVRNSEPDDRFSMTLGANFRTMSPTDQSKIAAFLHPVVACSIACFRSLNKTSEMLHKPWISPRAFRAGAAPGYRYNRRLLDQPDDSVDRFPQHEHPGRAKGEAPYLRHHFHPDAGKTTITEKLLLMGKAIEVAGTVKSRKSDRHATSDWMEMENSAASPSPPR